MHHAAASSEDLTEDELKAKYLDAEDIQKLEKVKVFLTAKDVAAKIAAEAPVDPSVSCQAESSTPKFQEFTMDTPTIEGANSKAPRGIPASAVITHVEPYNPLPSIHQLGIHAKRGKS